MPIKPGKDETQSEWMARCTPDMMGQNGGTKRPQEQAVAACIQMWKDKNKTANGTVRKQADDMEVEPGESHQDFIDRCTEELDEMECQLIWDERSNREVVHKNAELSLDKEFVLSDETVDRMGDVIVSEGWKLENFKRNPIALAFHREDFIVGRWKNLRVDKNEKTLRGHLELAPAGISPRIDEIRALVKAGILKAVSVGFKPLKHEPLDPQKPFGGYRFLEHELVETSLVAVPANANALAVAKSLNISPATMDLVFAKPGRDAEARTRDFSRRARQKQQGGQRSGQMSLTQRIQDCEAKLAEQKTALADHWANVNDDDVTDKELETANTLKDSINLLEKKREQLIASEKILGETSADNNGSGRGGNGVSKGGALTVYHSPAANNGRGDEMAAPAVIKRPIKKELEPMDYFVRAALVGYASKVWQRSPEEARLMIAKHRPEFDDEAHKTMCDIILRAATAPAMTTVTGWAAELVQQIWAAPMETLFPDAIYTKLAARGLSLSFGRAGKINIPTRSRTPTIAGSFVGEGAAIPVRQGAFTSQTLTPRKVAVITVWTREMNEHSTPAIEGLLRDAIQQDTSIAIDSVLIDNGAATAVRPAGLLNGVTTTGASALTTSFDKILADIKNLSGQLIANTYGNIRSPVWLLNPREENLAKFAVAPQTGVFPWKAELQAGTLNGWPTIVSGTIPLGTIILIDTADFVSVGGDAPRFELSDQATLHMEDTTPLDLASGSPATVASPQRSLFQTDSIALRMIMDTNWLVRRSGTVAALASVAW